MHEGGEDLSGLSEEATRLEPEDDADENIESEPADETARETVERVLREAQEAAEGDQGGQAQTKQEPVEKVSKRRGRSKKDSTAPAEPFNIPPPNRLTVEQKEIFHQLPEPLKRATHQMFKEHDGLLTQAMQRLTAREKEAAHIVEAVRPYLLAHPELQEQGYTESRIVAALIAAHQRLTDPKTARQAYAELGQQIGIDQDIISAIMSGQQATPAQPQTATLPPEAQEAIMWLKQQREQARTEAAQSILAELESVQNEMTPDGRYVYPKLHDREFIERWKPLVSALARTLPYAEAAKRAYHALEGFPGNSAQLNQARFPAQGNQLERAQQAAVSVRGRSAPVTAGNVGDIPPEALGSPRDTVRWALNQMRRGA